MPDDNLVSYIEDHMAGAAGALDLLGALSERHRDEPIGRFAADILRDVQVDLGTLRAFAESVSSGSNAVKEAAARVAEKISRLKLARQVAGPLGTFEALETLALGIWGKRALWRALETVLSQEKKGRTLDLAELILRAEAQHERVEAARLEWARKVLSVPSR